MPWLNNRWLVGTLGFGVAALAPILYVPTIEEKFFIHKGITWEWAVVAVAVALFTIISECYKIVKNALFPMTMHTDRTPIEIEIEPPPAPHVPLPQIASEDVQESFVRMETRLGTPTVEHEDYRSHHKPFSYHVNEEDEKHLS